MVRKGNSAPVIKDVALCAGVSVSTVSRYLNDSSHLSEESRERIARAIKILDYRPSPVARGLVTSKTKTIAVFSTNTTLYGSAVAIQGIEDFARLNGYSVLISKLDDDSPDALKRSIDLVSDLQPSGIILLKYDETAEAAARMMPRHIPVVAIGGSYDPRSAQVSLGDYDGGKAITEHLLALGHKTVHHICVPTYLKGASRTDGWEAALVENNIPMSRPIMGDWEPTDARRIGHEIADRKDVSAIFAGNDEIAMGVVRGLADRGVRVPDDISVAGFDDHPLSAIWLPALTTYRQDFVAAGKAAVEALFKRLAEQGEESAGEVIEIHGELVVRESTAAPRA
ncbi:LacI family DNA-binding transcriptional regulator [Arcanobacterium bovis]|uniref:LacI family transcriptional regulator n=1 Tax=Arcanobacterium bovis TaxID=2529275 RepID=A0A4Q9V0V3_9ACTO|nr:LacI family DNA-binding transcriptional regulator [Arcanobacterium bovis]TBW22226.1 LacI family transcriptional regulator [Arcanobacterium bovis]